MAEKLNIAKQQEGTVEESSGVDSKTEANQPTQEEFQRLLDSTQYAIPSEDDSNSAFIPDIIVGKKKNKQKVKKDPQAKIDAERAAAEQKRQDQEAKKRQNAQRLYFEPLINVQTNQAMGTIEAAKLVPWVPPYLKDCLMVIVDPRPNSAVFRQSIQYLGSAAVEQLQVEQSKKKRDNSDRKSQRTIQDQVIFITADSTKEMQAWLKRSKTESPIQIFSDPDLAWMNQYKASEGWFMSMLTFDTDGAIVENNVNIQSSSVTQLVLDTLEIMSEAEAT
ncbi:unnamed protein product [Cylindrotheca closterium]|uniref:Uncharacterized protein n=1 Tax=Cylindrotheca closterium TaxID=2856 RepID=A0AAD2FVS4_9STRA|nr:unnamed protein product [Cylindrotheca closterium]